MAQYQVPPDTKDKEKVIGGLLNWIQFFWLLAGVVLAMLLAFIGYYFTKTIVISAILAVIGIGSSIPFALVKKLDMPLFTYLLRKRQLSKKSVQLINKRKEV